MENQEHMKILVEKLCSKSMDDLQKIFIDVLFEVDYRKYLTMVSYNNNMISYFSWY